MTTVAVVGDSITHEAEAELRAALGTIPDVTVTALVGRPGGTFADLQDDADEVAASVPDIVVINLGSNDALKQVDTETTLAEVDAMCDKFPESLIVAVAVTTRFTDSWFDVRAQAVNDHLRAGRDERGVPAAVVAWDEIVAADDAAAPAGDPILTDGLHPSLRGRARLARAVADTVAPLVP